MPKHCLGSFYLKIENPTSLRSINTSTILSIRLFPLSGKPEAIELSGVPLTRLSRIYLYQFHQRKHCPCGSSTHALNINHQFLEQHGPLRHPHADDKSLHQSGPNALDYSRSHILKWVAINSRHIHQYNIPKMNYPIRQTH